MKRIIALAVPAIALALAGCGGSTTASTTTSTVTAVPSPAPKINAAFFKELQRLDDKFVATVSAVPSVRAEIMDRREQGTTAMANLAHDVCMVSLAEPVDGGPDMAMRLAGTYLEMSMYIMGESLSDEAKRAFVQVAARTYCPDNPAGIRG